MISTKDFNPVTDPKLLCTCGDPRCDRRSVNQPTLNRLQVVRDKKNAPMGVTSGGRCQYHPDELARTTPADHQKGDGVDVSCSGADRGNLVMWGIEAGFNAIGVAKTFVHLGRRDELPPGHLTMWVY